MAEETVYLAQKYDYDFIKMCPYGNYGAQDYGLSCNFFCTPTQPVLERKFRDLSPEEWSDLPVFPAIYGTYGKVLQLAVETKKELKRKGMDLPVLQTIFNPLTTAAKLAGPKLWQDIKTCPQEVKAGLEAISQTTINFINANIEAGVDGFFYASQTGRADVISREDHQEFAEPFDREVANAYAGKTWFNVIHIHGENTYWDVLSQYPGEVVNWHDQWAGPTLEQARAKSDKCFLGGLNERDVFCCPDNTADQVAEQIQRSIRTLDKKGLIIGPGCCANPELNEAHVYAVRLAVEKCGR
jgi:uroporphyrinogen decarboxylase